MKAYRKGKNWFDTGKYESILFIPATPESELQRRMQEKLNKSKIKIKVIEKSGKKSTKNITKK